MQSKRLCFVKNSIQHTHLSIDTLKMIVYNVGVATNTIKNDMKG